VGDSEACIKMLATIKHIDSLRRWKRSRDGKSNVCACDARTPPIYKL